MFIFICKEFDGVDMWWFHVIGNMCHYITDLYNKSMLRKEFVKYNSVSHTLNVAVYNLHKYKFVPEHEYHLCLGTLEPDGFDGYMNIEMVFDNGDYVAKWYRPIINNVSVDIWQTVYAGKIIDIPAIVDNDAEYTDNVSVEHSEVISWELSQTAYALESLECDDAEYMYELTNGRFVDD